MSLRYSKESTTEGKEDRMEQPDQGESLQLATVCAPRWRHTSERPQLIREWITKLALNAGQPIDDTAMDVYESIWAEGFADLSNAVLEAAFKKTLRTCKFWPIKVA